MLSIRESFASSQSQPQVQPQPQAASVSDPKKTLRFQVVVWYIGKIIQGRDPVIFRATLFWNALDDVDADVDGDEPSSPSADNRSNIDINSDELSTASASTSKTAWKMLGRQEAFQKELKDQPLMQTVKAYHHPPVFSMS
jgi:hypothetical protein